MKSGKMKLKITLKKAYVRPAITVIETPVFKDSEKDINPLLIFFL
jgi:hypothetical protein